MAINFGYLGNRHSIDQLSNLKTNVIICLLMFKNLFQPHACMEFKSETDIQEIHLSYINPTFSRDFHNHFCKCIISKCSHQTKLFTDIKHLKSSYASRWTCSWCTHLSTATAHLLSIRFVKDNRVDGHAKALRSVLRTVSMAPCFINSFDMPGDKWQIKRGNRF